MFWVKDSFPLEKGKKKTSNDLTSVDFFFLFPQTFCSEFQDRESITNAFCSDLGVEKKCLENLKYGATANIDALHRLHHILNDLSGADGKSEAARQNKWEKTSSVPSRYLPRCGCHFWGFEA